MYTYISCHAMYTSMILHGSFAAFTPLFTQDPHHTGNSKPTKLRYVLVACEQQTQLTPMKDPLHKQGNGGFLK